MRRREFIKLVGGSLATAWPLAARAQQSEKMRRIGVLLPATADDAVFQARLGVFLQELAILGWPIGRNMRIDVRWATGFMIAEYTMGGKWLELLKEIAPGVTRVAVIRDATNPGGIAQFGVINAMAPSLRVEVTPVNMRSADDIDNDVAAFARSPNGGLIITGTGAAIRYRELIITLAARHKLPAIYFERFFVADGGLISYGVDLLDQYRRAAGYIDRILKGEKPADMPVQAATKYELAINLKTAKALSLTVPPSLLARASEVIE